jgi:hypothetical protein
MKAQLPSTIRVERGDLEAIIQELNDACDMIENVIHWASGEIDEADRNEIDSLKTLLNGSADDAPARYSPRNAILRLVEKRPEG